LYLADIPAADMELAVRHCSDLVSKWLEGSVDVTHDFTRRVRLAEGAFVALCEALLKCEPVSGVALYRALQQVLATRFIGAAGVDELLQVAFRAPDSPELNALLTELSAPAKAHSDEALLSLAIAASLNGRESWLRELIANDEEWRKRRGIVLNGFLTGNRLPVNEAWPEGQASTPHGSLRRKAAKYRYIEACARHWWTTYLTAPDEGIANAAWTLFLRSVDQRAWVWIDEPLKVSPTRNCVRCTFGSTDPAWTMQSGKAKTNSIVNS